MLWSSIPKLNTHEKINQQVKKAPYNWILQHSQFVVYAIENNCLKFSIDSQVEPHLVPKLLLHVSVIELHHIMVSPPEVGGLKEARDAYNNIIIVDSNVHNILPPQLNIMASQYKVVCGCKCCLSAKSMHSSLLI